MNLYGYLVATVNVEPDCSRAWQYSHPLTFTGVTVGVVERLHPIFEHHGVRPTYLINDVVLDDPASVEQLGALKHCELATKLFEAPSEPQVELETIRNLTDRFQRAFNRRPSSFRAGQFAASTNTIYSLAQLGYTVDTSVTPGVFGAVDFVSAPTEPYFPSARVITEPAESGDVLEVPITIRKTGGVLRDRLDWLHLHTTKDRPIHALVDRVFSEATVPVLNMMLHNVEVVADMSPYAPNERDCMAYLQRLDDLLASILKRGVEPITLSELRSVWV